MTKMKTSRDPYRWIHDQVRALRGPATDLRCVQCGGPASEWALKANPIGNVAWVNHDGQAFEISDLPQDYQAMDNRCHKAEDARRRAEFEASFEDVLSEDPYKGGL
jgi:hypothetical protein